MTSGTHLLQETLLGILRQNEQFGFDDRAPKSCISGEIYHAPEYLLTPRLRLSAKFADGTHFFPMTIMRKRAGTREGGGPGFSNIAHVDKEEQKKGIYELECNQQPGWPPSLMRRCNAIDAFLHQARRSRR